jgi:4-amino-4-deoxy-L-arabinose transferase-like glycosyltransferase
VAQVGRVAGRALLAAILVYAAVLRLDALTLTYGVMDRPVWLHALQVHVAVPLRALRPASVTWAPESLYPHNDGPATRYFSDPYTYLKYARQMHGFYAAHYREPLFVFVTKVWLWFVNGQDVAVSLASLLFSLLTVGATYLVGARACSRVVGLLAAAAAAIEWNLISLGISGWRDEAFTFFVAAFAYALLRYRDKPSPSNSVLLGACAGAACLTRITAVSFIGPAFVLLAFIGRPSWKDRLRYVATAVVVLIVITGPYLVSCWRTFGDPLYAINYHTAHYLTVEGRVEASRPSAATYVATKLRGRAFQTIDTVVRGLTTYPFSNKWTGFDPWSSSLGTWLARAACLGLFLFVGTVSGRWLLLVLVTSLIPYSVTWRLTADWRFTECAYPFFLVAAGGALAWLAALVGQVVRPPETRTSATDLPWQRRALFWGGAVAAVMVAVFTIAWLLPVLVTAESLRAGEDVTIMAGDRDYAFFTEGWSPAVVGGLPERMSRGAYSVIRLPLPVPADYGVTLRLNPFPRPEGVGSPRLPTIRAFLNGRLIRVFTLGWNSDRYGTYDVPLPRAAVRKGFNRLVLQATFEGATVDGAGASPPAADARSSGFSVWYLRVRPPAATR